MVWVAVIFQDLIVVMKDPHGFFFNALSIAKDYSSQVENR